MNTFLFLGHCAVVIFLSWGAFKKGKEALTVAVCLQAVLANFFVLKQIDLFGWTATCSDVFAVGTIFCLNLLQEKYGKEEAKKTLVLSFFSMLFFVAMAYLHLFYTPSPVDVTQVHYQALLSPAPRLLIASLATFFIVQQIDVHMFGVLKRKYPEWGWGKRNMVSLTFSQLLDTALFSFLGLWGLVDSLVSVMCISFVLKMCAIVTTRLTVARLKVEAT